MKTSTVSLNWLFQIVQLIYSQSKKLSRQSLFTLLFVRLLNIYFFSKSFFLPFNQYLGASYLILRAGLVVKVSCCQIILYILHFALFPILIFKITFAISTFSNFLRNVQLKWFHFKHRSHTTEWVLIAIVFWQTEQNHFEFFFLLQSFKHSAHAESSQYFPINIFHIRPYKRWKICILLSTYFSSLMKSDIILTSDFNFPFATSTPFSMCFAVDVETTHSKRILPFFALFNLINSTIRFFGLFLLIFFEDRRPTTVNAAHVGLLLF